MHHYPLWSLRSRENAVNVCVRLAHMDDYGQIRRRGKGKLIEKASCCACLAAKFL